MHAAAVHFPITFIASAQILDVIYGLSTFKQTAPFVAKIYDVKPYHSDITRLSQLFLTIGILSAIPAILTGVYELFGLLSRQAVADKLAHAESKKEKKEVMKKLSPKIKIAFLHALVMDLVVAANAYSWYIRRDAPASVPSNVNIIISAVSSVFFMGAGRLGGKLVYEHGVGVYSAGALQKKDQ